MTRFRHDLILRMIKLLDAVLVTIPFAMCWYLYYAKRVASPYYAKGDYLVVALFFVLFIIFGRVYDAFLMSMQRISEIIYEQFLAAAVSDFIMYIVIWLLSKHLPNILPGVAALVGQVIMASIWAYNAHHAYFKTFPPQATAVIYDTRRGMEQLIGKYGLDAKYKVVSTATAGECIDNLSMLDGINTVFLSGIHSHDRNIILKYCVENNITVFVVPRIGDTIMSGAHHMHMFHLPMLRVGRYNPQPEYLFVKRLLDIVISAIALVILGPIFLVTAIAIWSSVDKLRGKVDICLNIQPHDRSGRFGILTMHKAAARSLIGRNTVEVQHSHLVGKHHIQTTAVCRVFHLCQNGRNGIVGALQQRSHHRQVVAVQGVRTQVTIRAFFQLVIRPGGNADFCFTRGNGQALAAHIGTSRCIR